MKPIKYQIFSDSAYQWLGKCKDEIYKLNQTHTSETATKKYYQFPDNIFAELIVTDSVDTIRMWSDFAGVIFHPRSGTLQNIPYFEYFNDSYINWQETKYALGVVGGWRDGKELLNTQYIFPLDDTDDASFVVSSEDSVLSGEFVGSSSLYGNLYWTNGESDSNKFTTLSWRGTPTRHFRLPENIQIPGFSIQETIKTLNGEDVPEYTAFGTILYQEGVSFLDAPQHNWSKGGLDRCLILGVMQDSSANIYIVAQSDHYTVGGGYYLTLWKTNLQKDGWDLITEFPYTRNGLPWFGASDGSGFVCSNGDSITSKGIFTSYTQTSGNYTEVIENNYPKFNISYQGKNYFEYVGLNIVSSNITANFSAISSSQNIADTYGSQINTYIAVSETDPGPPASFVITGPEDWSGNIDDYTVVTQPYIPNGVLIKYSPTGCGMQNVVFTLSCPDGSNTQTATFAVRMPTGVWHVISDTTYGDTSASEIYSEISGSSKTTEYITHGCNSLSTPVYSKVCWFDFLNTSCDPNHSYLSGYTHGPYPEPTVAYTPYDGGVCTPFAQQSLEICKPVDGNCPVYPSNGTELFYYTRNNTYYANVMRRIIYSWECS